MVTTDSPQELVIAVSSRAIISRVIILQVKPTVWPQYVRYRQTTTTDDTSYQKLDLNGRPKTEDGCRRLRVIFVSRHQIFFVSHIARALNKCCIQYLFRCSC